MSLLRSLRIILSPELRREHCFLTGHLLLAGIIQSLGVVSIIPFLQLVSHPSVVEGEGILAYGYRQGGFTSFHQFLIAAGGLAFVALLVGNGYGLYNIRRSQRFVQDCRHDITTRILRNLVRRPYQDIAGIKVSGVRFVILGQVLPFVNGTVLGVSSILSDSLSVLLVLGTLAYTDAKVAVIAVGLFGLLYGLVYSWFFKRLDEFGRLRYEGSHKRIRVLMDLLESLKEIKVNRREGFFLGRYARYSEAMQDSWVRAEFMSVAPRYIIETLVFGSLILLTVYAVTSLKSSGDSIRLIGIFAFACHRLMPNLRTLSSAIADLRLQAPVAQAIIEQLAEEDPTWRAPREIAPYQEGAEIELRGVCYRHPGAETDVLKDVNLKIPALSYVGVIGRSGSGKTTLVDLLSGLLHPSAGKIFLNGKLLPASKLGELQAQVAYVNQQVRILDDTVAGNVAFGIPLADRDPLRIYRAIEEAGLAEVVALLPEGLETLIGTNGRPLSGGQQQRIGIARALYKNAQILLFDEATSSLDAATENDFLKTLETLRGHKTIVIVSHRLNVVRDCDCIVSVSPQGHVLSGDFSQLCVAEDTGRVGRLATVTPEI